jgi:thioredoxin-related protein
MRSFFKRIELITNVSIIIVAVLLTALAIRSFLSDRSADAHKPPPDIIKPGMKFLLPGVDWSKKDSHLVLVLQKGCHFCSESAPFYRRLVEGLANRTDLELIAALPQNAADAQQYLNEIQVPVVEVRQANMATIKVYATPTILLVDKTGMVTDLWRGKLQPDKELEVLNRLHLKV